MKNDDIEYKDINEPLFCHPIMNKLGVPPKGNFSVDHRLISNNDVFEKTIHWHNYFEFEFIIDGNATHMLNNRQFSINRGSAALLTRSDFHTYRFTESQELRLYNICFDENSIPEPLVQAIVSFDGDLICQFKEEETQRLDGVLRLLEHEFINQSYHSDLMIQSYLINIFISFLRQCEQTRIDDTPHYSEHFKKALYYLENHFREDISLSNIAVYTGITPNYLGQLFMQKFGISYNKYITRKRLHYAISLFSHDLPINKIAIYSGFNSVPYFIATFKKYMGITPVQYRKRLESNDLPDDK